MENKELPKLTHKQKLFCDAYMGVAKGNGVEAARLAGYKGDDNTLSSIGVENLRKPAIIAYMQNVNKSNPLVMGREELQQFWTDIATGAIKENGKPAKMSDRIKASELLGRSQGAFLERVEISTPPPAKDVLGDSIFAKDDGEDDEEA